ncbi:MAG: gluconate 2-dehydrogenase subunit 3 family protein [Burkholderiales bacterium]|nr:gluconate 2-dehydrogenase subunit 3 family protein [Burkholderiales bacterium]
MTLPAANAPLSPAETAALRAVAGRMIPAAPDLGMPGADDAAVFADIVASLDRDAAGVRQALAQLDALAGGRFADLDAARQDEAAARLRAAHAAAAAVLVAVVVRCYYRDDRVMRALGMEARPPFPRGFEVRPGDFSLLDPVRARGPVYRPAP